MPELAQPGDTPHVAKARKLPATLLALGLYLLLTLAMFWPVVASITTSFPQDLGDPPSQAWVLAWAVHALTTNPAQLWNGNIFYPFANTFAYQDNLLGLLPLSFPLLTITHNPLLTYNLLFLLSFALTGWTSYLFVRSLMTRMPSSLHHPISATSRWITGREGPAFLGGLIIAFAPARVAHWGHLNVLATMYLPLCFLAWEAARCHAACPPERQPTRWQMFWPWLTLGVCGVLETLCSLYTGVFLALGLAILFALDALAPQRETRRIARRMVIPTVGTASIAGLLLWPILRHYVQVEHDLGTSRPLGQLVALSPDLRDFLHTSPLNLLYGWTDQLFPSHISFAPQFLFPGLVPLALAAIVIGAQRIYGPQLHVTRYALLGLFAAILALGPVLRSGGISTGLPLPYLLIYDAAPPLRGLRDTGRLDVIVAIALAMLAASGLAYVQGRVARSGRWGTHVVGIAIIVAVVAESWVGPIATPRPPQSAADLAPYRYLATVHDNAPVLELPISLDSITQWNRQALMMYDSIIHWHPIVNGTGGFSPPGYDAYSAILESFPAPAALHLLRHWHVRYVLVHQDWLSAQGNQRIQTQLASAHRPVGVQLIQQWPNSAIYRLAD